MRDRLIAFFMVAFGCCTAADVAAQTPAPMLLRITFVASTPTPTATPNIAPTATPEVVPTIIPTEPPANVPEPTTITLVGLGVAALAYRLRQTRRRMHP